MFREIILAKNTGFCFGVERALNIVEESKKSKINILGSLIHNEYVVDSLIKKGIKSINALEEADTKNVVISAHGVPNHIKEEAKSRGINIIDATCPLVAKVHQIAKELEKKGYLVAVIGKAEHTEVKGIIGNLKNYIVIENNEDIIKLKDKKIGIVVQTTEDVDKVNKIMEKIKTTAKEVVCYDTICPTTKERQSEAKEIAKKVDLMIVIGSKKSNNTKKLFDVCSKNIETKHIENYKELKEEWFDNVRKVGITAGASTPKILIDEVYNKIKEI